MRLVLLWHTRSVCTENCGKPEQIWNSNTVKSIPSSVNCVLKRLPDVRYCIFRFSWFKGQFDSVPLTNKALLPHSLKCPTRFTETTYELSWSKWTNKQSRAAHSGRAGGRGPGVACRTSTPSPKQNGCHCTFRKYHFKNSGNEILFITPPLPSPPLTTHHPHPPSQTYKFMY